MIELFFYCALACAFMLALVVPYSIFILIMYVIYKAKGGIKNFKEYSKQW